MDNKTTVVARPLLQRAMPLMFAICVGFAIFNTLLGLLFLGLPSTKYLLPNWSWSLIFVSVGLLGAYYLLVNHWKATRNILIAGLLLKAIWMFFLILLIPKGGAATLTLWGFLAYIQAVAVVYFPVLP